jgi:hypothetical protein
MLEENNCEDSLAKILKDPTESTTMRFLAALVLMELSTVSAYTHLLDIANATGEEAFPANLLAGAAILKSQKPILFRWKFPEFEQFLPKCDFLCQTLMAMHMKVAVMDENLCKQLLQHFLESKDSLISFYACANYQSRPWEFPGIQDIFEKQLLALIHSSDLVVRSCALPLLTKRTSDEKKNKQLAALYLKYIQEYWKQQRNSLQKILENDLKKSNLISKERIFSVFFGLFPSPEFIAVLDAPITQSNRDFQEIKKIFEIFAQNTEISAFVKLWSSIITNKISIQALWSILENPEANLINKILAICSIFNAAIAEGNLKQVNETLSKFIGLIQKIANSAPKSKNEKRFKQLSLYIMQSIILPWFPIGSMQTTLEKDIQKSDEEIRRTAISLLLWEKNLDFIPQLEQMLKTEKNMDTQRAIITSLASFLARYQPGKIKPLHEYIRSHPDSAFLAQAAASGYENVVQMQLFENKEVLKRLLSTINEKFEIVRLQERAKEDLIPILEYAIEIYPCTLYFYQCAVVMERCSYPSDLVQKKLDLAFQYLKNEPKFLQKEYKRNCQLLQARLSMNQNDVKQAQKYLKEICANNPLDIECHFEFVRLRQLSDKQNNQDSNEEYILQAYLLSPEWFKRQILSHKFAKEQTISLLQIIHKKFPLDPVFVLLDEKIQSDPWIQSLKK